VKGRLLSEEHYAEIVALLKRNHAIFEITGIDLGGHSQGGLLAHQQAMADAMTANLTDQHHPNVVQAMNDLRDQLLNMKLPGYVQSVVTFNLIERCLAHSTLYYCQRLPKELGNFTWVVDAKDSGSIATPWEKWWTTVSLPVLQSMSLREPGCQLEEGDYRYFEPYLADGMPPHLAELVGPTDRPAKPIDLRKILSDLRFSSGAEGGLELVDILTNGVRRAMLGNLQAAGWLPIRELMIHRESQYVSLVSLNGDSEYDYACSSVIAGFRRGGRPMLLPENIGAG
jgi:hypothetical protein